MPMPFKDDPGETPFSAEEDAESLALVGWCWGAPSTVRFVIGRRVYMDMRDRTVRRLSAFMVN